MIRKILISTIVLFFFVSTTGLPLTIHFCSMSKTEMAHCKMHSKCMHCENEEHSHISGLKIEKKDCCETEFKYEAIGDKFLQINSQKDIQLQNLAAIVTVNLVECSGQNILFINNYICLLVFVVDFNII